MKIYCPTKAATKKALKTIPGTVELRKKTKDRPTNDHDHQNEIPQETVENAPVVKNTTKTANSATHLDVTIKKMFLQSSSDALLEWIVLQRQKEGIPIMTGRWWEAHAESAAKVTKSSRTGTHGKKGAKGKDKPLKYTVKTVSSRMLTTKNKIKDF